MQAEEEPAVRSQPWSGLQVPSMLPMSSATTGNLVSPPVPQFPSVKGDPCSSSVRRFTCKKDCKGHSHYGVGRQVSTSRNLSGTCELTHLWYWFKENEFWKSSVVGKCKEGSG